jgi:hypothetical protein
VRWDLPGSPRCETPCRCSRAKPDNISVGCYDDATFFEVGSCCFFVVLALGYFAREPISSQRSATLNPQEVRVKATTVPYESLARSLVAYRLTIQPMVRESRD